MFPEPIVIVVGNVVGYLVSVHTEFSASVAGSIRVNVVGPVKDNSVSNPPPFSTLIIRVVPFVRAHVVVMQAVLAQS